MRLLDPDLGKQWSEHVGSGFWTSSDISSIRFVIVRAEKLMFKKGVSSQDKLFAIMQSFTKLPPLKGFLFLQPIWLSDN